MTPNYTSFLVCAHEGHTDLFINGLPLAIVKDGRVELAKSNPMRLPDCIYEDEAQIEAFMCSILAGVRHARKEQAK